MGDKDGTLTECDKMFGAFQMEMVELLRADGFYNINEADPSLLEKKTAEMLDTIYSPTWLDYDRAKQKFGPTALMVRKSAEHIYRRMVEFQVIGEDQFGFEKICDTHADLYPRLRKVLVGCEPKCIAEYVIGCGDVKTVVKKLYDFRSEKLPDGIKCALCTMDQRPTTEWMMEILLGKSEDPNRNGEHRVCNHMEYLCCSDTVGENRKPHPIGIQTICKTLNIPIHESIMVGDSITDMQAGIRAGCKIVIFVESGGLDGKEIEKELVENGDLNGKTKFYIRKNINEIIDLI